MTFIRIFLLALLATASAHATQMYSWTDANGTRHFSDRPPPETVAAKKIDLPKRDAPAVAEPQQGSEDGAAAIASDPDAQRLAACTQARSNLATLRSDVPVRLTEDDDDFLDDAQRQKQIEVAEKQVALYCD